MPIRAIERQDTIYQVFQFPADMIPRIDGYADDWSVVPDSYAIGTDQLRDDSGKHDSIDRNTLDVSVKVGWVKGLNRLYFLYEAYDDYWDFSLPGLHNDTYEVVVDADLSGGPLIDQVHRDVWTPEAVGPERSVIDPRLDLTEDHWARHGVHAQNYHIFTPAEGKDWTMEWGVQPWIKELPYANAACNYSFRPGDPGRLVLEFWITPFDYAGSEGPLRAVESVLRENKIIGLCWAIIDYDDVNQNENNGFWNLSDKHTMYGNASHLCAFRLMPLEKEFLQPVIAQWSFKIIDMERRLVAFKDLSYGKITSWIWDFGDGTISDEQHPVHMYQKGGDYIVVLYVEGPEGKARMSKVWDVSVK
ncbi:MAG: PKD domain-containing protein [Bacteroidales bacterium]|nr:PKD domain-containing protein [Bacteroidales bacterium]